MVRPMLSDCLSVCLSVCPVLSCPDLSVTLVYCGQTVGRIKMKLGMQVGLGPGHIVLDRDPACLPKKGAEPPIQFLAHFYCDQTAGCTKMPLGIELILSPGDIVLDGDQPPSPKRGRSPHKKSVHVYCGQTAGWIKIVVGMEVGLSLRDFILDGDTGPLPQKGGGALSPIFGPFILRPNGWIHQDASWYDSRPHPRGLCVR